MYWIKGEVHEVIWVRSEERNIEVRGQEPQDLPWFGLLQSWAYGVPYGCGMLQATCLLSSLSVSHSYPPWTWHSNSLCCRPLPGISCGQPRVFCSPFQNSSSEKSALGMWDLTAIPSQEHSGFVSLIAWWLSGLSRWLDYCLLFLRLVNSVGRALVCTFPASVPQSWGIHECF